MKKKFETEKKFTRQKNKELLGLGFKVYNLLVENFPQTFFVGGLVRDVLLNREVTDVDIATEALPVQVVDTLKKYYVEPNIGLINLGVVLATEGKHTVTITTFRKDQFSKSRYPKVTFLKSLKTDAQRRDFTINALYLSPKNNTVEDFTGGIKDLKAKKIRFIGDPGKKMKQDPLRIIRALRFALILKFKLESKTKKTLKKNFGLTKTLTESRINKELDKISDEKKKKILMEVINNPKSIDKYFN